MQKIQDHNQLNHLVDRLLTIRKKAKRNANKKEFKNTLRTFLKHAVTNPSGQLSSDLHGCMGMGLHSQGHKYLQAWLCVPTAAEAR